MSKTKSTSERNGINKEQCLGSVINRALTCNSQWPDKCLGCEQAICHCQLHCLPWTEVLTGACGRDIVALGHQLDQGTSPSMMLLLWWLGHERAVHHCQLHCLPWTEDEFLDVIYWGRQVLGVALGLVWGFIPLKGFIGLFLFCVINAAIVYFYASSFQGIDEEEFGGMWELTKEGFVTSFAGFLKTSL
ncbi:uncharacterized protein LOC135106734 isoform X1 [Scylla paramamosain]|uniref:uncharacterized protein LOC135106734 isoform X1 n=1 Tax=Scylla paramamosain TaxID=85552 RepID=UPI0030835079